MISVDRCLFVNRAPFKENLEISFKEGVNLLCGINGRGKTTILSYIVDALYEMARPNYQGSFEGKENDFYRVSSSLHAIDARKPSIVYIRFKIDERAIDYIDVRGKLSEIEYNALVTYEEKVSFQKIQNGLQSRDYVKLFSCNVSEDEIQNAFGKYVLTYFPSYRYELPGFLNAPYKEDVRISNSTLFSGVLINPIEVCTGLSEFSSWILDLVLDWEVNKSTQKVQSEGQVVEYDFTPESALWNNLSVMIKNILISKELPGRVRFGIGRRNLSGKRISIMHDMPSGQSELICPNITLLSSGETALICLFGEIIRQADRLRANIPLNQIKGIVLIDEIEKHLHIRLQKDILPKLLLLFPGVQFIVASHSPFLNMGLASVQGLMSQIYDLDNGALQCEPTTNELYQKTYELFLNEKNHYASEYMKVKDMLKTLTRPVVITEGKTDIKHILKAMEKLGIERQFDVLPEAEQPNGDGDLKTIINNLSLIQQPRKVIAVFDRDNDPVTRSFSDPFKDLGNNVFALRIQCPQCRKDEGRTKISIEYMYSDDEIHSVLPNGRQLFFGNEFNADSLRRHKTRPGIRLALPDGCGKDKIIENNGGQAVFDNDDTNLLAKKEEFARAIINDQIDISQDSWENFRTIINVINQIIAEG